MTGIFLAAFSYAAALMGAGFASGQEVTVFFAVFGRYGAVGIAVASALIALFCSVVSEYTFRYDCDYGTVMSDVFPCFVRRIADCLTFVFTICVEAVMYACFGEMLHASLGCPVICGAVIAAVLTSAAMFIKRRSVVLINAVIGAAIFILSAAVCLYLLGYREHQAFNVLNSAASGASYAGYNLLGIGAITASGRVFLKKKGDGLLCGFAAGAMIFILLMLMWGIVSIYYGKTNLGELPMLTLTLRENKALAALYTVIIAASVLTTAFSDGICAAQYLEKFIGSKPAVFMVSAVGLAFSGAGFSRLIDTAYRYCGMAGIIIAVWVIAGAMKIMVKREKRRF